MGVRNVTDRDETYWDSWEPERLVALARAFDRDARTEDRRFYSLNRTMGYTCRKEARKRL